MKKTVILMAMGLAMAGCTQTQQRTGTGALLGAGAGAAIGGVTGGATGAATGAAIGAGAGAIAGASTAPRNCVNANGVRVSC